MSFFNFLSWLTIDFQLLQCWIIFLAFFKCLNLSISFLWKCTQWYLSMTSPFLSLATAFSSNSQHPQMYSQFLPPQVSSCSSSLQLQFCEWSWFLYSVLNLSKSSFSLFKSVSPVNLEPDSRTLSYVPKWSSQTSFEDRAESPKRIGSKVSSLFVDFY